VRERFGPITTLVHAAGRIAGALARNLSSAEIGAEFGARVQGLMTVMAALGQDPLDLIILNSSLNVLHGGEGQTAYVASNAILSGLACKLRERASRVHVVHWDRWRNTGLGTVFEKRYRRLKGEEIKGGLYPEAALRGLRLSLQFGLQDVAVSADGVQAAPRPMQTTAKPASLPTSGNVTAAPVSGASEEMFRAALLQFCRVRLSRPQLSADDKLLDVGIDSLEVLELQVALEQIFGVKIFSAALMTEPLGRLAAACNDPSRASTTLEIIALEKFSAALTRNTATP
jgi:acyl carrier protein